MKKTYDLVSADYLRDYNKIIPSLPETHPTINLVSEAHRLTDRLLRHKQIKEGNLALLFNEVRKDITRKLGLSMEIIQNADEEVDYKDERTDESWEKQIDLVRNQKPYVIDKYTTGKASYIAFVSYFLFALKQAISEPRI
jgi:hypothetical protein